MLLRILTPDERATAAVHFLLYVAAGTTIGLIARLEVVASRRGSCTARFYGP